MWEQPRLKDKWGQEFFGKAETATGGVWWYEIDGECYPLLPFKVQAGRSIAKCVEEEMMMETKKNPYKEDTPEHQLWETAKSADLSAASHWKEVEIHTEWARAAQTRAEKYRAALEMLTRREKSVESAK